MKKKLIVNSKEVEIDLSLNRDGRVEFTFNGEHYSFSNRRVDDVKSYISGDLNTLVSHFENNFVVAGKELIIESPLRSRSKTSSGGAGHMQSPMPGKILQVLVKVGDSVKEGDSLIVMEAMKMEHTIKANSDGKISAIHFSEGQQCAGGVDLVDLDQEEK
ncbi:acetyl-CoA carboxylase biotin carboxyl carrier protein subunit [Halobacteriovorax sp. JY17]|uniref:biotin/lipoyl-containing protein n=1 Tax=Halobacteriovorax sp. JY17 TaxID=2014617 RepID=UPI000C4323D0|nr:acetyl-CoA carboxylase biotin carboxyl carrier protein subunit [Halobacteriovorax sp. JY17]PIK15930.1 MAG: hypothetical protein CES88_04170 [Halobacteriovorax sp. JY17]